MKNQKRETSVLERFFVCLAILIVSVSCQKVEEPVEYARLQALYVPVRDGVRIAVDVWLPENLSAENTSKVLALGITMGELEIPTLLRACLRQN